MLAFVCLEIVLTLTPDRCTTCAECTAGSKSFWMHSMDLLGEIGHVESRFNPFGDTARVSAR
jgi:hypothetical protein